MDKREIINIIENKILDIANLYNEVDTSDLQGIVCAETKEIIDLIINNKEVMKND